MMIFAGCKKDEPNNGGNGGGGNGGGGGGGGTTSIIYGNGVTDIDGNPYASVIIGSQEWMTENLKTTKYNDGTNIPNVAGNNAWKNLSTPAYCWYDNNSTLSYGAFYNWFAVATGKLCPTGWHVPSDAEWTALIDYLHTQGYTTNDAFPLKATTGWSVNHSWDGMTAAMVAMFMAFQLFRVDFVTTTEVSTKVPSKATSTAISGLLLSMVVTPTAGA